MLEDVDISWFDPAKLARSGALLSDCRMYRYVLWRFWHDDRPFVNFVMLNPSTADAYRDDRTIRRCANFANLWSTMAEPYGGIVVTNLYAIRSKSPKRFRETWPETYEGGPPDGGIIGRPNNAYVRKVAGAAGMVVCAWGANVDTIPGGVERAKYVRDNLLPPAPVTCFLALTASGQPRHPLYLKAETYPTAWK